MSLLIPIGGTLIVVLVGYLLLIIPTSIIVYSKLYKGKIGSLKYATISTLLIILFGVAFTGLSYSLIIAINTIMMQLESKPGVSTFIGEHYFGLFIVLVVCLLIITSFGKIIKLIWLNWRNKK